MTDEAESGPTLVEASAGMTEHTQIAGICEAFRMLTAEIMKREPDQVQFQSLVMTAAVMFAGSIFGTLIFSGLASDQDKRRVTESMMRNFREGIIVGKNRGMRVMSERYEGRA